MVSVTALSIVLSTLALLSQGYAVDESCYRYGPDIVQRVVGAMGEGWELLSLAKAYVTIDPRDPQWGDLQDNTRYRMFEKVDPPSTPHNPGQPQPPPAQIIATQLGQTQGRAQSTIPQHAPIPHA
jgi:hypothetical protein